MGKKVSREDLVVGEKYFIDASYKVVGTFVSKIDETIYFDCGKDHGKYLPSRNADTKGLIGFSTLFQGGFEPYTADKEVVEPVVKEIVFTLEDMRNAMKVAFNHGQKYDMLSFEQWYDIYANK